MAKTSPMVRSFNAGIFSALMEGRTDLEFYPASMRRATNCILTPQGPVLCRSGTRFVAPANQDDEVSALRPFVYNNEQAKVLEIGTDRIRFIDEEGVQVYAAVAATILNTAPLRLSIPLATAIVGDQFVLSGFPANFNLNGEIVQVTAVAGTDYTFGGYTADPSATGAGSAALVYTVYIDFTSDERKALRVLQDVDLLYLLVGTKRTQKLQRYGDYDWRLSDVELIDGPYLPVNETSTTITVTGTGNAIPDMTANNAPAGFTATASGSRPLVAAAGKFLGREYAVGLTASQPYYAFDNDDDTYWAGDQAQVGTLEIQMTTPAVVDGYVIYAALDNNDITYLNTDFSPSTWYFEGYDGSWHVLDFQENYITYDHDRSVFFEIANTVAYSRYRIRILKLKKNGPIEPRIRRLTLRAADASSLTLTASAITGINKDQGFKATDVGRLIRIRAADNFWRWLQITTWTSATVVTAELRNAPFVAPTGAQAPKQWRLGIWSDTTGWPAAGDWFGDRLFMGPSNDNPNVLCGSVVGLYENFTQAEDDGTVLDDGAIVHYIRSPQLSRIKWIISNDKGLIVGTGAQEFVVEKTNSDPNFTPANIGSNPSTNRGSADANPMKVDNRILHVPRNGRALRELIYSFDSDGYVSNNLSRFASHLGTVGFAAQAYSHEPHTINWVQRGDNSLVSVTYNRDEGVIGWGEHDFAGAEIEGVLVIPQQDQQQDALWVQTRRVIDGVPKRYIEYLTRPWDFGMTLDDAVFVDCAITYSGAATDELYGAQHLEGLDVYGLARTGVGTTLDPYVYLSFGPVRVSGGRVGLPFETDHVTLGLGFESVGETPRLENGAVEGTAQGKVKRINSAKLMVWDTAAGQIGAWDGNNKEYLYTDIDLGGDLTKADEYGLTTDLIESAVLDAAYSTRGSVSFRRQKEHPVPFNIIAILPKMNTYDS